MLKKRILIISSIIVLLILIVLIEVIYFSRNFLKSNIYEIKNKTYYEVTLKPNTYFLNDKLESNNYYIASSIKTIDIYFNYYIKNKIKDNYFYDITATLKSYGDNGTKLIWTKDFILKEINNINQKEISIKENYNLIINIMLIMLKLFRNTIILKPKLIYMLVLTLMIKRILVFY